MKAGPRAGRLSGIAFCLCAVAAWTQTPSPDSVAAAKPLPVLSLLMPAEGDVFYGARMKVVARANGPVPRQLSAVLDGVRLEQVPRVEKGIVSLELTGLREGVHVIRLTYLDEKKRLRSTSAVGFFIRAEPPPRPPQTLAPDPDTAQVSGTTLDSGMAPPATPPPPPPKLKPELKQYGRVAARVEWKNDEAASRVLSHSELREVLTVPETDSTYPYDTLVIGRSEAPFSRNLNATAEVSYNARYERWEAGVKGVVSTNENRFRQSVNRFSASAAYGPWAHATAGDVYPEYNPLIFSGTRVRGAEAGAALVRGEEGTRWVYARVVTGETQRFVPAYIIRSDLGGTFDTTYVAGTRRQNMTAIRLGTGGGGAFEAGATLMKAVEIQGDSAAEALNEYLYGPTPAENLVGGLDARLGIWDGKVQFHGQGALSFYTSDRSLGSFGGDTAGGFRPGKYRTILVVNPTTNGWEYMAIEGGEPDYPGFLNAASAYTLGASASIPLTWAVWETDVNYSHLGIAYRSEGNPFLGSNPGDGWSLQQRLGFLENRLHLGAEVSRFLQEFADSRQLERAFKVQARFTTREPLSALWVNAGTSRQTPQGNLEYRYRQDFDEFNLGASRDQPGENGSWNLFSQYGYTRGRFYLEDPEPAAVYPASVTHAITSSASYRFHNSDFIPKVSHTYADNGVQKPANGLGVGMQDSYFEKKAKVDGNLLVREYARTATRNGVGFSQNLALTLRFRERESLRLHEKSLHSGGRVSVIAGANYERSF